jgi:hypothetical protein
MFSLIRLASLNAGLYCFKGDIMKLHCNKCNKVLTKDLYQTKKLKQHIEHDYCVGDEDGFPSYHKTVIELPQGAYLATNKSVTIFDYKVESAGRVGRRLQFYKKPATFSVSKADTLNVPNFKEGWGCCDYHGTDLVCSCGSIVGTMNYDCWIDFKRTDFYQTKTHFENS